MQRCIGGKNAIGRWMGGGFLFRTFGLEERADLGKLQECIAVDRWPHLFCWLVLTSPSAPARRCTTLLDTSMRRSFLCGVLLVCVLFVSNRGPAEESQGHRRIFVGTYNTSRPPFGLEELRRFRCVKDTSTAAVQQ